MVTDAIAGRSVESPSSMFPQNILNFGFYSAIILAGLCLLATTGYLVFFLFATSNAVEHILNQNGTDTNSVLLKDIGIKTRLYMANLSLVSCGIMVGMSFGFLGFGLFLIGMRDVTDASVEFPRDIKVKLLKISPGLLLLLSATVLIGVCATHTPPYDYQIRAPIDTDGSANSTQASQIILEKLPIEPPTGDIPLPSEGSKE